MSDSLRTCTYEISAIIILVLKQQIGIGETAVIDKVRRLHHSHLDHCVYTTERWPYPASPDLAAREIFLLVGS
jgi:hypothetical protein